MRQGSEGDSKKRPYRTIDETNRCRSHSDLEGSDELSWEPSCDDENIDGLSSENYNGTANDSSDDPKQTLDIPISKIRKDSTDASDDDLEVLLVIQPPTPKRPKPRQIDKNLPPPAPKDTRQTCAESGTVVTPFVKRTESDDSGTETDAEEKGVNEAQSTGIPMTTTEPATYPYQTSAYVQNLAEICNTILWDRRWRVRDTNSRLFMWERGDDLSAMHALSGLYVKNQQDFPRKPERCSCPLCRSNCKEEPSIDTTVANIIACEKVQSKSNVKVHDTPQPDATDGDHVSSQATDEDEARALYLYCRLFYRKGPWFRLDDLYNRYYAPKGNESHSDTAASSSETNNDGGNGNSYENSMSDTNGRGTFFLPKHKENKATDSPMNDSIDRTTVNEKFRALTLLCRDVARLHAMGLVRSFCSEEECGKTVGVADERKSLLTADERRVILSKLGAGSKKRTHDAGVSRNSSESNGRTRSSQARENQVWKQMCRQQSIVAQIRGNSDNKVLLPVQRHANELILNKLATKAALSSSQGKSLPASVLREQVSEARNAVLKLSNDCAVVLNMCIRLREAPLRTLRRSTRLYLCASNGPGNMRGDGSNGWMSLRDHSLHRDTSNGDIPLQNLVHPPGAHTWHNASYPALMHRFGISTCAFTTGYRSLPVTEDRKYELTRSNLQKEGTIDSNLNVADMERVFSTYYEFQVWELCTEVRANVDYLVEANDLLHYFERRKARQLKAAEASGTDNRVVDSEQSISSTAESTHESTENTTSVDFLDILTTGGRARLVQQLLAWCNDASSDITRCVQEDVENEVRSLLVPNNPTTKVNRTVSNGAKQIDAETETTRPSAPASCCFTNSHEKMIGVIAAILLHVLISRHRYVLPRELSLRAARPWLRHMWWDGNLAYVLWDCIPVLERRGYYELASNALEVLLFGSIKDHNWMEIGGGGGTSYQSASEALPLAALLISRRARGKAFERLVIDYSHILRIRAKEASLFTDSAVRASASATSSQKRGRKKQTPRENGSEHNVAPQKAIASICGMALKAVVSTGSIPFSAIRSLARRTKRPLVEVLGGHWCMESSDLGLRLENSAEEGSRKSQTEKKEKSRGYRDWNPVTDKAVANAIAGETSEAGKRCSFVGFEDDACDTIDPSSLSVEELAMEFYKSGRLPSADKVDANEPLGGWVGWHDEGGHVRALFRILCASTLLGVDGGCDNANESAFDLLEKATIFLTPYQGAPMDLHVGHSLTSPFNQPKDGEGHNPSEQNVFVRGFYQRHRARIDMFLSRLENLDNQELSDLVFDSVVTKLRHLGTRTASDTVLQRDLQHIRTLSMLATGFGGKLISAMFRCLLFDYRHYSGGLPDLLLVRALYNVETEVPERLVDLGEWVGEGFTEESKNEQEMSKLAGFLVDKDDEFLGCNKVGDSGAGQGSGRWGRRQRPLRQRKESSPEESRNLSMDDLPPRLSLIHDNREVQVQCMFVEVKSSNDRLDPRQEDWLNVLDRYGNARVCKFGNGKIKKSEPAGAQNE